MNHIICYGYLCTVWDIFVVDELSLKIIRVNCHGVEIVVVRWKVKSCQEHNK